MRSPSLLCREIGVGGFFCSGLSNKSIDKSIEKTVDKILKKTINKILYRGINATIVDGVPVSLSSFHE
jgi:hypothetical protein